MGKVQYTVGQNADVFFYFEGEWNSKLIPIFMTGWERSRETKYRAEMSSVYAGIEPGSPLPGNQAYMVREARALHA